MATPFVFVPRAVSKCTKEWQGISRLSPSPSLSPPPNPTTDPKPEDEDNEDDTPNTTLKAKRKEKDIELAHSKQSIIAQDIASLISLALSDYNIWLDADLRWKLDTCLRDETSPNEAGFVPINYLLRRTPFRGSLPLMNGQPDPSETEVVKALRTHASHTLEVRMRLPSTSSTSTSALSSSVWYGTGKTSRKKDVGGYEVRRRDWPTLSDRPSRGWTRARWDEMTVYIECIPPTYRTVGGVARFAETLLPAPSEAEADVEPCLRIQNVAFPPHYLDKPGDRPKCKGYALVTFSAKLQIEAVLRAWPWKRRRVPVPMNEDENVRADGDASPIVKEAHKYGLRVISKARWDTLNEEYLRYKQHLVDEVARTQTEVHYPGQDTAEHERGESTALPHSHSQPKTQAEAHIETTAQTETTLSSPYPFNCLVFVRNVHPQTNKTTLKSLFAQAFQGDNGLDYVDFNKCMDTCYLRLASPHHATWLIDYFGERRTAQAHGLDATGRTPIQDDKLIAIERIQGTKEELYWEKLPEKIRRQAVEKAVKSQSEHGAESSASLASERKKRTREQ